MLRPKPIGSKFKFLEISQKVENRSLQWLLGFFVFAIFVTFISEHLPSFLRQFSFQIFLSFSLLMLAFEGWRPSLGRWGASSFWSLLLIVGYFFTMKLLDWICFRFGYQGQADPWVGRSDWILLAVVAPIIEELFFRDALFKSLAQRLGRIDLAVLFSSAFFMVAHLTLYPGAFLLGAAGCLLVLISRSIWPAILFHSISNLSLLFIPTLFPNLSALMRDWGLLPVFYR